MSTKKYQVRIRKELSNSPIQQKAASLLGACTVSEITTLIGKFVNLKDAFEKIIAEGLLSENRLKVYQILFHHGPLTAGEVFDKMEKCIVKGSVSARLTELRQMGVAYEVGTKKWSRSGHTGILFDINDQIPRPLDKDKSKAEIIKEQAERIKFLESQLKDALDEVRRLKNGELF
jgi:DNA-binding transcriptional ArsR family regulator